MSRAAMKQCRLSFFVWLFYGLYGDFCIPIFSGNLAVPLTGKQERKICGNLERQETGAREWKLYS